MVILDKVTVTPPNYLAKEKGRNDDAAAKKDDDAAAADEQLEDEEDEYKQAQKIMDDIQKESVKKAAEKVEPKKPLEPPMRNQEGWMS